jgi:adenylate kinase
MDTKLIFIGGIHGVGKSTFCEKLQSHHQDIEQFSASDLIKSYKSNAFTSNKKVGEIVDNQEILVSAYNAQEKSKTFVLLDGHYCLFNSEYEPQNIPVSVFRALKIQFFILLTAPIDIVLQRMESRDEIVFPPDKFRELQSLEASSAKHISSVLKKPLLVLNHKDITENSDIIISQTWKTINQ